MKNKSSNKKEESGKERTGPGNGFWENKEIMENLRAAFANDFNITEACSFAKISRRQYTDWKSKHPEDAEMLENERLTPHMAAKQNIIKTIHAGDVDNSWKFLHTRNEDYRPSSKTVLDGEIGVREVSDEKKALIRKALGHANAGRRKAKRSNS